MSLPLKHHRLSADDSELAAMLRFGPPAQFRDLGVMHLWVSKDRLWIIKQGRVLPLISAFLGNQFGSDGGE